MCVSDFGAKWFGVTHETSNLREVNEAHFAWKEAIARGKSPEEVTTKHAQWCAAKRAYIANRK